MAARSWPARLVGTVIGLIGVILTADGGWLVALGGSAYYLLTGLAMIGSGALLIRSRILGAWLYVQISL